MESVDRQDGLLQEILLEAYVECQKDCEGSGKIPHDNTSTLARFTHAYELVGAILFGIFIASLTMLLVFIVTRMVLHLEITLF